MRDRLFLLLVSAAAWLMMLYAALAPAAAKLPYEGRAPAAFSAADADAFFADRLPHRTFLLRLCRDVELALGKNEYGGAICGKDGYILSDEAGDADTLSRNIAALNAFAARTALPTVSLLIPQKTDALPGACPALYRPSRDALWEAARTAPGYVELLPTLRGRGGEGKYIYYRGDHHLTSLGAYYVYRAVAAPLGVDAAPASDFTVGVVCADFSGSDARRLLTETDDRIALFRAPGDSAVCVTEDGVRRQGLYRLDALGSDAPYGVFPGYDAGYTRMEAGEARPRLLLLADSYGCALAPFLVRHFDVDLLDLRYSMQTADDLVRARRYTAVLCCYGIDTLAAHEILFRLLG